MSRKTLFIVNPEAGTHHSGTTKQKIRSICRQNAIPFELSEELQECPSLIKQQPWKAVVAVGGDGTVREIGRHLINTDILLGIIPLGSGNGLARHLNIPLDISRSLSVIRQGNTQIIDVGQMMSSNSSNIDPQYFLNAAGIGFDARVARLFENSKSRGISNYVWSVLKAYWQYEPQEYTFEYEGKTIQRKAFMLTLANGSQYGGNIRIAPQNKLDNESFQFLVLSEFPKRQAFSVGLYFLRSQLAHHPNVQRKWLTELTVHSSSPLEIHLDGETIRGPQHVHFILLPKALSVLSPPTKD